MFKTTGHEFNPLLAGAEAEGFGVGMGREGPTPAAAPPLPRGDSQAAMNSHARFGTNKDPSLLDGSQAKGHHLAAHDETKILLPELSQEPAARQAVFEVDKELDSKPFV